MSDVKPLECPFCGGTTGRYATDAGSSAYVGKWGWWECDCGARAEDVRTGYDADGWQADALTAWNRRAGEDGADFKAVAEAMELAPIADAKAMVFKARALIWERDTAEKTASALRAEVARLRESLAQIANHPEANVVLTDYGPDGKQRVWPTVREEAIAALSHATSASGWLPIATAPRDGTEVLLWSRYRAQERVIGHWAVSRAPCRFEGWTTGWETPRGYDVGYAEITNPTHWQPLPEPPAPPEDGE